MVQLGLNAEQAQNASTLGELHPISNRTHIYRGCNY
jgi:hypothetical protein